MELSFFRFSNVNSIYLNTFPLNQLVWLARLLLDSIHSINCICNYLLSPYCELLRILWFLHPHLWFLVFVLMGSFHITNLLDCRQDRCYLRFFSYLNFVFWHFLLLYFWFFCHNFLFPAISYFIFKDAKFFFFITIVVFWVFLINVSFYHRKRNLFGIFIKYRRNV